MALLAREMVEDRGIPEPAVAGFGCRSELEEREDIRALKPHLAELGDRERTLFEVRFGAEETQPEIGAELGASPGCTSPVSSPALTSPCAKGSSPKPEQAPTLPGVVPPCGCRAGRGGEAASEIRKTTFGACSDDGSVRGLRA